MHTRVWIHVDSMQLLQTNENNVGETENIKMNREKQ